jgi:hypothetical protein
VTRPSKPQRPPGTDNCLTSYRPKFSDPFTGNIVDRDISFRSLNPANQEREDEGTRDDVAGSDVVARGAFVRDNGAVACGEAGFKSVLSDNWYGLIAPAGLPAEVETRLRNAASSTLRSAELKKQ